MEDHVTFQNLMLAKKRFFLFNHDIRHQDARIHLETRR